MIPHLVHAVLCEKANVDDRNTVSLVNIIESIDLDDSAFPKAGTGVSFLSMELTLYALFSWQWPTYTDGSANVALKVTTAGGESFTSAVSTHVTREGDAISYRLVATLVSLPIDTDGMYEIHMIDDTSEQLIGKLPLIVSRDGKFSTGV